MAAVAEIGTRAGAGAGSEAETGAESYEDRHVHSVYEQIAPHFSSTRHKPWPLVAEFLHAQPPGSVGLDVGCGNGKYLGVNPAVALLGSDRSPALVRLARERAWDHREDNQHHGPEPGLTPASTLTSASEAVAVADGLALPFRVGSGKRGVDFVICVAVVHHLSTRERRVEGVRALLECLREGGGRGEDAGKALVYVWALEQGSSRRGWDEDADQDQLVPWVMRAKKPRAKANRRVGGGGDRVNPAVVGGDEVGQGNGDGEGEGEGNESGNDRTYQRYYHLYRKGELEEDVVAAGGVVLESGYEKDNWWAIASRKPTSAMPPDS